MRNDRPKHEFARPYEGPARNGPPHVLLVEDDDVMREMLAEAFRREGWRVTECPDAMQWLHMCVREAASSKVSEQTATASSYDVVVSDIRMPTISGLDVLRILGKVHCAQACPPTIFITAFGNEATHKRARDLGAVTVLDKPFDIRSLIEKARAVAGD